jgi:hypothetical protein
MWNNDVDLKDLLSESERNLPFRFSDTATIPSIPGLIAGGVSVGQDFRSVSGKIQFLGHILGYTLIQMQLRFLVREILDFCPGNKGGSFQSFVTTPLSRLEASGLAYDVPFEVHYDAPTIVVPLNPSVVKSCLSP